MMGSRVLVTVWDLPVRVFHWSLALAVAASVITGHSGGLLMEWHGRIGLVVLGLLAFRLPWGLVGSTCARFGEFFPTPRKLKAYVKGQWEGIGHNPLGALSVFALLGFLALQATTGLFANDDITFQGPLYSLVGSDLSERLSGIHRELGNVLLALIVLHVAAIAFYWIFKKKNLVRPMITGNVEAEKSDSGQAYPGGWKAFALSAALALCLVGSILYLGSMQMENSATALTAAPAW